jgi:DNA-directed RNA polymerase subunit L
MRSCPECLNQIDENESVCPHCGHVLLGDEPEQKSVEVYLEERKWTFGNTLIALLLVLLIGGLGWLLYIYGFKLPYEDATKYYQEEKAAYEQQVQEYQELSEQIAAANTGLDAKIAYVRSILNSGEEPMDPRAASNASVRIQQAESLRVTPPVITAEEVPTPARDSAFHAKDVRETARIVDQQRFSLYQQYSDIKVPDYSQVIAALDEAADELKASIQLKKDSEAEAAAAAEAASRQIRELLDNYQSFMDEYITFMAIYDRGDPDQLKRADELQTTFVTYLKQIRAIDTKKLTEADQKYFQMVTESISRQMADNNIVEPEYLP